MKFSVFILVLYQTQSVLISGRNNPDTTAINTDVSPKNIVSSGNNIEMAEKNVEIPDTNIEILERNNELSRAVKYPCQCIEGECGCCTGSLLANFNWNVQNRMCSNITYYPEDFEFHVRFIFNDNVFYQRRMSGKNPRPLCANIPRVQSVKMCIVFSNVYVAGRNLHMCLSMETKWRENTIYSHSFDCIRVGTAGVALLKPEEGGGLPPPKPVEENTNATVPEDYDAVVASEGDEIQSA